MKRSALHCLWVSLSLSCASVTADDEPPWVPIFDGTSLDGWTPKFTGYDLGEDLRDTFRAEEGVLRVDYSDWDTFDGEFGHLFYDGEFSRYRVRLEYRFVGEQVAGGPGWAYRNNGIMVHGQAPESMGKDQEFPVSIEVQLLGGNGTDERHTGNLCTPGTNVVIDGELVTRHCTDSTSKTYHGDGWVTAEVEVLAGETIRHFIDGELVLEYALPQLDERDPDAQRLLGPAGKLLTHGTISLQAESHPCEFRRIELLVLED